MSVVIMFPGQGSQSIGMGKDLYDNFLEAKEVFQEVDEILKQNLSQMIFHGDIEELTLTQNAQPAIMAASVAVLRVVIKQSGRQVTNWADYTCGHSLGEYSAYIAAGSIGLADTTRLLRHRGMAMAKAALERDSAMAALLGCEDQSQVEALVAEAARHETDGVCEVANDNGIGQFVISGTRHAIGWAIKHAAEYGVKKAIKLNVSGAFHSSLMDKASKEMRARLSEVKYNNPNLRLITNVNAEVIQDAQLIAGSLATQIASPVKWRQTMDLLIASGVSKFFELGPGKVLSSIAKRMSPQAISRSICSAHDIEELLKLL